MANLILPSMSAGPLLFLPATGRPYRSPGGVWADAMPDLRENDGRPMRVIRTQDSHRERCLAIQIDPIDGDEHGTIVVGGNVLYTKDAVEIAYRIIEQRDKDRHDEKQRLAEERQKWREYVYNLLTSRVDHHKKNPRTDPAPVHIRDNKPRSLF